MMGGLMAKEPDGGDSDYTPIDAGNHHGVCYRYYDLGTQQLAFEGTSRDVHRVLVTWELPNERIEINQEDLPKIISKEYTLSLHKKSALRQHLESWRGRTFNDKELDGFSLDNILGANCMINIIHNTKKDKTYANVGSIAPLMKGMAKREAENEVRGWSIVNDGFNNMPEDTPEWIKSKIQNSLEYEAWSSDKPNVNEDGNYDEMHPPPAGYFDGLDDEINVPPDGDESCPF